MIIKPKTRGFLCTNAHPVGCAQNVKNAADYAESHKGDGPKRVLVVGSSTGYGLAGRIASAFCYDADTIGVFLEREPSGNKTASAGWYNNRAFEVLAKEKGLVHTSINGDAFSDEVKQQTIDAIRSDMPEGKVDLVIYSLASPRRTDPKTGETFSSVIKPVGQAFSGKTVDFHTGAVTQAEISPANPQEIQDTIRVMGGEDWKLWMDALKSADVLADRCATFALSYIGPELTYAIYKDGTIGKAKQDLQDTATEIDKMLKDMGGKALISVNKALVTQASAAIPVVPLYISLLYRVMKDNHIHEECTEQMVRLLESLYSDGKNTDWSTLKLDDEGRMRMDNLEMQPEIQQEVKNRWAKATSDNIMELSDLVGYKRAFLQMFGFEVDGVDYEADVEIL